MKRTTTRCQTTHHAEVSVEVGGAGPELGDRLIDWIESTVTAGSPFELGETVQYCSAIFQVRARSDKTLALFEPKPGSLPVVWIDSVEDSLRTIERQRAVAAAAGLEDKLDFADPLRLAYLCARVRPGVRLKVFRTEPQAKDTGWCALCCERDHDHQKPEEVDSMSVYELGVKLPEFRLLQALPIKTAVRFGGERPTELAFERTLRTIAPGSILASLGLDRRPSYERGW